MVPLTLESADKNSCLQRMISKIVNIDQLDNQIIAFNRLEMAAQLEFLDIRKKIRGWF
jgi:hypothetical protein